MYLDDKASSKVSHIDLFNNKHYRKKKNIISCSRSLQSPTVNWNSLAGRCHRKGDMTPPDPNNTLQANWIKAPKK